MFDDDDQQQPEWTPPATDTPAWTPPSTDTPATNISPTNAAIKTEAEKQLPGPSDMPPWQTYLPAIGATAGTAGLTLATLGSGPPGWLALAAAGGLGAFSGSLAKQAIDQQGVPKDPGAALKEAGTDAAVQGVAPELVSSAVGNLLGRWFNPERQYKIALRPSGSTVEADKAVQAGLKGKIKLGWDAQGASAKNDARSAALDNEIDQLIQSVPGSLSPQQYVASVRNKLDAVRVKWMRDPILDKRDTLYQIDEAEKTFLLNHAKLQPIQRPGIVNGQQTMITIPPERMTLAEMRANAQPLPYTDAQGIKQQSYVTTRANKIASSAAWNPLVQPGLDVEERGAITSALKEDLENTPGFEALKNLNRDSGESQALTKALETFSRRLPKVKAFANAVAGGAAGLFLGHSAESIGVGAGLGVVKWALEDPMVRSRLAIALYAARETPAVRAAASLAGRAAVRLPFTAGKILIDADKAKQFPQDPNQVPQQAKGGKAKSDDYLREVERRAYSREAILGGLRN